MSSDLEIIRSRNIEDNKRILKELGLLNPFKPLPRVIKKAGKRKRAPSPQAKTPRKKKVVEHVEIPVEEDTPGRRRRSARLRGVDATKYLDLEEEEDEAESEDEDHQSSKRKFPKDRPNVYGVIPGVEVGTVWQMRSDCSYDGIHRPWVAGIHGGAEGAVSIALSGGYEDDIDMGDCFTYTGEGGRDLKGTRSNPKNLRTAPQSKDQSLTKGNLALVRSVETGNPVRVIRGYKSKSPFAPEDGYRYDGIYKVEKHWFTTGTSGFGVFKFAFRRIDEQAPPPWSFEGMKDENNNEKCAEVDRNIKAEKESDEQEKEMGHEEEKEKMAGEEQKDVKEDGKVVKEEEERQVAKEEIEQKQVKTKVMGKEDEKKLQEHVEQKKEIEENVPKKCAANEDKKEQKVPDKKGNESTNEGNSLGDTSVEMKDVVEEGEAKKAEGSKSEDEGNKDSLEKTFSEQENRGVTADEKNKSAKKKKGKKSISETEKEKPIEPKIEVNSDGKRVRQVSLLDMFAKKG